MFREPGSDYVLSRGIWCVPMRRIFKYTDLSGFAKKETNSGSTKC